MPSPYNPIPSPYRSGQVANLPNESKTNTLPWYRGGTLLLPKTSATSASRLGIVSRGTSWTTRQTQLPKYAQSGTPTNELRINESNHVIRQGVNQQSEAKQSIE